MKAALWVVSILLVAAIAVGIYIAVQTSQADTTRKIAECQSRFSIGSVEYFMCAERYR